METAKDLLYIGSLVILFLGMLAVGIAHYRAKSTEAIIDGLRGDRDDLASRVERLEKEKRELEDKLERERTAMAEDNRKLHEEVRVLRDMVTNRDAINELVSVISRHDERVDRAVGTLIDSSTKIMDKVEAVTERLSVIEESIGKEVFGV